MLDGNEEDLSANSVLQFWGVQFSIGERSLRTFDHTRNHFHELSSKGCHNHLFLPSWGSEVTKADYRPRLKLEDRLEVSLRVKNLRMISELMGFLFRCHV